MGKKKTSLDGREIDGQASRQRATREQIEPLASGLDTAVLRLRLQQAVDNSGMSLVEIGNRMGIDSAQPAKNIIWNMLNINKDPGLFKVLKLCEATGVDVREILAPVEKPAKSRSRKV